MYKMGKSAIMENQLKATELRCGNILNYLTSEGDYSIMKVNWHSIKWISEDETGFNLVHSPIPLTEDILVKLGFEIEGLRSYYHNDLDITIEYLSGKYAVAIYDFEINPASTRYIMHCEFLHTLQNNIFALTGEELTFKN